MNNLTCNCVPRLDGVSAAELGRLFPEPSITAPLLPLLQESGIDGFNLRSIVVLKDDTPILLLPLFETRFDLSTFVEGWIKKSLKVAGRLIPSLFQPRVLSVGLVVGEWSEIGIDPHIEAGILEAAYKMAFAALQRLAAELKATSWRFTTLIITATFPGKYSKNSTGSNIGRAPNCRSILTAWRNSWLAFQGPREKTCAAKCAPRTKSE